MPYVAHKRLVTIVHSPIHHVYYTGAMIPIRVRTRVRPSILAAELNRIRYLPRPSSRSYIEEYLNSRYSTVSPTASHIILPVFFFLSLFLSDLNHFNIIKIRDKTSSQLHRDRRHYFPIVIVIVVIFHQRSFASDTTSGITSLQCVHF